MLTDESIASLAGKLKSKDISPVDIAKQCLEQIEKLNPTINAFITKVDSKAVLDQAKKVKLTTPLSGIPYVLKDAYLTKDLHTTAGSNVLSNYIPEYEATVVHKVNSAGAILLGKMNMDAWGHGGSTENTDYGPTKNPWDITRVPGGSGGGPAAAIAARMCSFAIGEDTGGSIRNPAGWCGITGLKVTYGRVSRYGSIAYASSFDTVGPTAKTAEDCALILQHIAGQDPYDATSSPLPMGDYLSHIKQGVKGKTIGIPKEFFEGGLDDDVEKSMQETIHWFKKNGFSVEEVSLPNTKYALSVYYVLMPAEASTNLARFDGIRYGTRLGAKDLEELYLKDRGEGFGAEVKRRITLGTFVLSSGYYDAYYHKAQKVRALISEDFNNAFKEVDVVLGPVTPSRAFKIGEKSNDPLSMYLSDIFTIPANMAGLPAISLPVKKYELGGELPVGFHLVGKRFREADLINIGRYYEGIEG